MNCVNRNLPEFKMLQGLSGTNEFILAAKISVWQDQNGLESFPTIEDLGLARQPINEVDKVTDSTKVKEGVSELFESNPELANIGTQQAYSNYLDTIFPDSKVKDIVYHFSEKQFQKFSTEFMGKNFEGALISGKGLYFLPREEFLAGYYQDEMMQTGSTKLYDYNVLINLKNPYNYKANFLPENADLTSHDGVIRYNNLKGEFHKITSEDKVDEYVVFEPEQIHILGETEDIQGFKEFVGKLGSPTVQNKSLLSGNVDTENDFISGKDLSLDNKLDWRTEDNDSEDPFMC